MISLFNVEHNLHGSENRVWLLLWNGVSGLTWDLVQIQTHDMFNISEDGWNGLVRRLKNDGVIGRK